MYPDKQKFLSFRNIGKGGINDFDDPQDIQDTEVVDAQNMIFDGAAEVRPGSFLMWDKPSGETNAFLCAFDARTSDGLQYVIAVYAPNFYIRDEVNNQWIKINGSYTPPLANISLMYSYINWNAGRGADVLYACNGTDDFIKYPIGMTTITTIIVPGTTDVTVADASYLPATGTLVLQDTSGIPYSFPYSSKTGNVIFFTTPSTNSVAIGAGAVLGISNVPAMAKGKVLARHQRRLFVANYYGGESNVKYSNTELPEDFSTGSGVTKGGALTITDGNGGITLMTDFGDYLIFAKEDSAVHFEINYNANLDAKLDNIFPVISDKSLGPINVWSTIKKNKTVYYPTATEGILALNPIATGNSTSLDAAVKSKNIQSLYKDLNFSNSRTTTFLNKILWSCASNVANDTVLVYDTLRDYWTKFNNWNVKDWVLHNSMLLFASRIDGKFYQAFLPMIQTDNDTPYTSFFQSKEYDFGEPSLPKTGMYLYVQGLIGSTTKLYVDVFMTQGDKQKMGTYLIDGAGLLVSKVTPEALAMVMLGVSIMGMGSSLDLDNLGIYRAYLALPIRDGYYTLSFRPYSKAAGDYWSMTGFGHNPELVTQVPSGMTIGVVSDPTNE